jgi:integrase
MASVERRERLDRDGNVVRRYRVRWRGPDDRQRSKTFRRKVDADRFAATVAADIMRGHYIDPDAGRVTFEEFAQDWLSAQTFDEITRQAVDQRLRLHAFPTLGHRRLSDIRPSTVQLWLQGLGGLASTYRAVIFANVSTVFTAAVEDGLIAKNPCRAKSVRRPKVEQRRLAPWTPDRVLAVRDQLPDRYRLVVWLGAGLGLRQGEIFGLSPGDFDLELNVVHVRRQVRLFSPNRLVLALPKGRKARDVPLPASVANAVTAHLGSHPSTRVELPWEIPAGTPTAVELVLSTREGTALNRNYFNTYVWRPALRRARVEATRENGTHALRHFFASTVLHEGESIKALSEYLGHADAGFTLRTYTHLVEDGAQRTKRAIDTVFATERRATDG